MMNRLFMGLCVYAALAGCHRSETLPEKAGGTAVAEKAEERIPSDVPPTPKSLGIAYPEFPSEITLSTAETYRSSLQYQKTDRRETVYFTRNGQAADRPQPNGYYREVLGKTTDGRTVAADYYQEGKTLRIAPFVIRAKGGILRFAPKGNADSMIVRFGKNGRLADIEEYRDGVPVSPIASYHSGRLVAQTKDKILTAYYEDGKTVAMVYDMAGGGGQGGKITYFRPDGSAIGMIELVQNVPEIRFSWDASGRKTNPESVAAEARAAEKRYVEVGQLVRASIEE
ncbi:hypothetical protein [Kingella denitrificans]|uniref:MORN repeat protein n=1 Tax=Kingella denitrificans ATCC 33394 TaxID=888741 RepID=F0EWG6_9NEIS|nr:hypothetical protein [Kingella denitrificans]EGC18394.1 hypothetical protein HMPREF9098_0200 [Kingella denitrificans ATCC 33394]QQB41020.1 hypothetical protein I6I17_05640 [Kingella denitrificans]